MFNALLWLGLLATSFAFLPGSDLREIKLTMAITFAVALTATELFTVGIKPVKNFWIVLLLAYMPISSFISPDPMLNLIGINMGIFWCYKPLFSIIVFALLFFVVSGHDFTEDEINKTLRIVVWCGFITGVYVTLQFLNIDQFFKQCADGDWGRVAGFIGNPTLTAPFAAMVMPIALYRKDYIKATGCFLGAVLPDSQIAWVGLAGGLIVYFMMKGPKWFASMMCASFLGVIAFCFFYTTNPAFHEKFDDHERMHHWTQILKDWNGPISKEPTSERKLPLTGRGIGSFRFVYHMQNPGVPGKENRFHQAHNDYLEFLYSAGLIGLGILLMSVFWMVKENLSIQRIFSFGESDYMRALFSSFAVIAVTACGNFVFQVGTTAFFTVIVCGLIHNERQLLNG